MHSMSEKEKDLIPKIRGKSKHVFGVKHRQVNLGDTYILEKEREREDETG